jgi:hypothetical protein
MLRPSGRWTVSARVSLGPLKAVPSEGHLLALSRNEQVLYALVPSLDDRDQKVASIIAKTMQVQARFLLPQGVLFRALVTGPRSGRLYVFGNRPAMSGGPSTDLVATVIDPATSTIAPLYLLRRGDGRDWYVFDASIDSSERNIYVSFHGACDASGTSCTSGADRIAVDEVGGLMPCAAAARSTTGCLSRVHGQALPYRGGVLATTGDGPLVWLTRDGRTVRAWPSGISRNHLMHVALARDGGTAYVDGSCLYSGGIAAISLSRVKRSVLGYQPHSTSRLKRVCGERLAVDERSHVLLARNLGTGIQAFSGTIVSLRIGRPSSVRFLRVSASPLDVMIAQGCCGR